MLAGLVLARARRDEDLRGLVVGAEWVCATLAGAGTVAVLIRRALPRRRSTVTIGIGAGEERRLVGRAGRCVHALQETQCDDDDG